MKALNVHPKIHVCDTFEEFHKEFNLNKKDLIITNKFLYEPFIQPLGLELNVIFQEEFAAGEPSDQMIDEMNASVKDLEFDRVIGIGGGSVIDVSKIFALDIPEKSEELYLKIKPAVKKKTLILVPTTCGTGSEVTSVSVAEIKSKGTKIGLQTDDNYGDYAVLIPETLRGLPYNFFFTCSIDALIHAAEGFLAPEATEFVDMYSKEAIRLIMTGYKDIAERGSEARFDHLRQFLIAATYAGIAFGNTGCAAVHALSMTFGGNFHVAHGEANYLFFTEVFKTYMKKAPQGKIQIMNRIIADVLELESTENLYEELDAFFAKLFEKRALSQYGMTEDRLDELTDSTIENQQRLLVHSYVPLSREELREIMKALI